MATVWQKLVQISFEQSGHAPKFMSLHFEFMAD